LFSVNHLCRFVFRPFLLLEALSCGTFNAARRICKGRKLRMPIYVANCGFRLRNNLSHSRSPWMKTLYPIWCVAAQLLIVALSNCADLVQRSSCERAQSRFALI
jgi:hypothetical protein